VIGGSLRHVAGELCISGRSVGETETFPHDVREAGVSSSPLEFGCLDKSACIIRHSSRNGPVHGSGGFPIFGGDDNHAVAIAIKTQLLSNCIGVKRLGDVSEQHGAAGLPLLEGGERLGHPVVALSGEAVILA
jgi:hypothetical protein